MASIARERFMAYIKESLASGFHSDVTITCGDDTYKAHKIIVCRQVEFFERALGFGGQESEHSLIKLPEDDPDVVKHLMQFLYEADYDPKLPDQDSTVDVPFGPVKPESREEDLYEYTYKFPHDCSSRNLSWDSPHVCPHHTCGIRDSNGYSIVCSAFICKLCNMPPSVPKISGTSEQLLLHVWMYEIADKYDVVGLKDLVAEKFSRACKNFWDDDKFAVAADCVFTTTPDGDKGLRNIVSAAISGHIKLIKKPEIKALMETYNGLALSILEDKFKEHGWDKDE